MNKAELQENLLKCHKDIIDAVHQLPKKEFLFASEGKWTAGQQLKHLVKSVAPVTIAFALPDFLLKILFGTANRPSRPYEVLVEKYKSKLAAGGKAPSQFVPAKVSFSNREGLAKKLQSLVELLCKRINSKSEDQLDLFVIPHPLLGKLTLREMLYFSIYHCEHHHKSIIQNLTSSSIPND